MGAATTPQVFSIRQNPVMRLLAAPLGAWNAAVEVDDDAVVVHYGVGFRGRVARSAVRSVSRSHRRVLSWGAHGWRGRWLVNGSSHGIVVLGIEPRQPARVVGWPVRLRELDVSVDDPEGLVAALGLPLTTDERR